MPLPPNNEICAYTVVRNTSGQRRYFSFLPPNGRWLDNNEEYAILGNIWDYTTASRGRRERDLKGLIQALQNGSIQIVRTPAPILVNGANIRMLNMAPDNSVNTVNPCWA